MVSEEVAGIYCRLSLARMKDIHGRTIVDQTKVEDQERISRDICLQRKWPTASGVGYPEPNGVFIDNNKSAWQRNRKRPGWDAMLEAVDKGLITRLALYHGDRLVRQPWDLELLINLADQRGIIIASATGDYQLDVATDRFVLRILTAAACMASDDTSRRKKQGFARMARDGRAPIPGGRFGRGFGYEADGSTPHPAEAAALRKAAESVLAGESLTWIARDLTAAGVRSTSGEVLNYQSLKRILLRPRIAGLLADGKTPGNWEPVIDRETFELVRGVLERRKPHSGGTAKYLLSGIATCWACGHPVQRCRSGGSLGYGCVFPGCRKVHRNMALLDAYVQAAVVERLNHPRNPPGVIPDNPGLAAQIATLTTARAEAADRVANPDEPHLELLIARLDTIDTRIAGLQAQADQATSARLVRRYQGISYEQFTAAPLGTRRALVTAFFTVELLPVSRRGPGFSEDSVHLGPV